MGRIKRLVTRTGKALGFYKEFDGKRYSRQDKAYKTEKEAEKAAYIWRIKGYNVRITKELVSVLGLPITSLGDKLDFEYVLWKRKRSR